MAFFVRSPHSAMETRSGKKRERLAEGHRDDALHGQSQRGAEKGCQRPVPRRQKGEARAVFSGGSATKMTSYADVTSGRFIH